jgi:hypothetical protein
MINTYFIIITPMINRICGDITVTSLVNRLLIGEITMNCVCVRLSVGVCVYLPTDIQEFYELTVCESQKAEAPQDMVITHTQIHTHTHPNTPSLTCL